MAHIMKLDVVYDETLLYEKFLEATTDDYKDVSTYPRKRYAKYPPQYKIAKTAKLHHDKDLQLQDVMFDEAALALAQAPGLRATIHEQSCTMSEQQEEIKKCKADLEYRDALESHNQETISNQQEEIEKCKVDLEAREETESQNQKIISNQQEEIEKCKADMEARKETASQNQKTISDLRKRKSKLTDDLSQSQRNLEHQESELVGRAWEAIRARDDEWKRFVAEQNEAARCIVEENAALRRKCEELKNAAKKGSMAAGDNAPDSGMDKDGARYQLEVSQAEEKRLARQCADQQVVIVELRSRDAAASKKIVALEDGLSQYDKQLEAANEEIAHLTPPPKEDEEMVESDLGDAPSTPDSLPSSMLARSEASTPATSSSSPVSSVGDSSAATELTDAQPETVKDAAMLDVEEFLAATDSKGSRSRAKSSSKLSSLSQKLQRGSHDLLSGLASNGKPRPPPSRAELRRIEVRMKAKAHQKGEGSALRSVLTPNQLKTHQKRETSIQRTIAAPTSSPWESEQSRKKASRIRREQLKRVSKTTRDSGDTSNELNTGAETAEGLDRQFVLAKQAHQSGDQEALSAYKGKLLRSGDGLAMLYVSTHKNIEDVIIAELPGYGKIASPHNPVLKYDPTRINIENQEDETDDAEEINIDNFAMQCALVHIPELHLQAATEALAEDLEELDIFKAKFEGERGLNKIHSEKKSPIFAEGWKRAVKKLAKLAVFRKACIAWISDEPSTGKWCWPPTFKEPALAAALSLNPEADLAQAQEELERSKLSEDFQDRADPKKEYEDTLSAAMASTTGHTANTHDFDRQGRATATSMYGPGANNPTTHGFDRQGRAAVVKMFGPETGDK